MSRALVCLLVLLPALSRAQVDGGAPAAHPGQDDAESLRRDFDAKLEAARREVKELREEMRAQLATQSTGQGWQEEWVGEKRKLELLTLDGYLRARPELFYKFDMGRGLDPADYALWPRSPITGSEHTNAGVNMRFRLEPTINVSEEVRVRAQIDALDNMVWGSTPDYAYSLNAPNNYTYDRSQFSLFSFGQVPQRSGINSLADSIAVKRVWGEVDTPVGLFRFGRMGSHWGLGMLHNDGNGIDSDWGDTVDRFSFTVEPLAGFYASAMLDFNVEGLISARQPAGGQPVDLSTLDDARSYILVLARRDTEQERRAKLDSGKTVFNYGLHFTYRTQRDDAVDSLSGPFTIDGQTLVPTAASPIWVPRRGQIFVPDLWARIEQKNWRIEAEAAAILGSMENRAITGATANAAGQNQALYVYQFGATLQAEYRFLNGDLEVGLDLGFASGDSAPGFGLYPRRRGSANGFTAPGDIDGPQFNCSTTGPCSGNGSDNEIRNFRFNPDYRVDMILYREILGGITDSIYLKPRAKYRITQGFDVFVGAIYSRAIFLTSTPGSGYEATDPSLGIELNGGVRYETEEGFFGQLQYGILFPLDGFKYTAGGANVPLEFPQALRGMVGIRF